MLYCNFHFGEKGECKIGAIVINIFQLYGEQKADSYFFCLKSPKSQGDSSLPSLGLEKVNEQTNNTQTELTNMLLL